MYAPGDVVTVNIIWNEIPAGSIDGINRTFALSHLPDPVDSLQLYLNGNLQHNGEDKDYTITDNIIVFNPSVELHPDDDITATYPLGGLGVESSSSGGVIQGLPGETGATGPAGYDMLPYSEQAGDYTALPTDYVINCSGTLMIMLPTAVGITGKVYIIKNSGTGVVTISGDGSETIDGSSTKSLSIQYSSCTILSDGANWIILQ
jgi:hypothetical protein